MSRFLDLDSPQDRETLAQMIAAGVAKAAAELPIPRAEFATVTGYGKVSAQALPTVLVALAGDPAGTQRECTNLLPSIPEPGDRVWVVFMPPSGIYILGSQQTRTAPCAVGNFVFTGVWGAEDRQPMLALDESTNSLGCGFDLVDGDDSGNLNTLIFPWAGIYAVSFGALVGALNDADFVTGSANHLDSASFEQVVTYDEELVAGTVSAALNGRAALVYAEQGDQLYMVASSTNVAATPSADSSSLSVWALCCDYVPGTVITPE